MLDQLNNSYTKLPDSIGKYVPNECPACDIQGEMHYVLVCQICGAPPAMDGKCFCDWQNVEVVPND